MSKEKCGLERDLFGNTADGVTVERYTLRNACGATARLITYGAAVTELWIPDRHGELADVVLGFDALEQYETESPYFGCMIGRVAFRIANGAFELDGKRYQLTLNDGTQHLHGGVRGFNRIVWRAEPIADGPSPAVKFTLQSPDGDQGYPGALDVAVLYALTEANELTIECTATTDQPTPINLTHHSYFNLKGAGRGDILGHLLQLDADRWIYADQPDLPSGEILPVKNTPFDFRQPIPIGARIDELCGKVPCYDVAYLRNASEGVLARVAKLQEPSTGRSMEVLATEPAVVLYSSNYLDGSLNGKGGACYPKYSAVCLETGRLPDSVHHPSFPSTILRPNETYRHTCVYRFSAR